MKQSKIVVLDIIGLSPALLEDETIIPHISALKKKVGALSLKPSFPAVTCTVQASLTTATPPSRHGMICNGLYDRATREIDFWGRYNSLLSEPRIWQTIKRSNPSFTSSLLFFQNSVYSGADYIVTPAPLHTHDGGMIQWCYSRPSDLYPDLAGNIGKPFNLMSFWGPMTSFDSSRWIFDAGMHIIQSVRPDISFMYIPHLDYSSQKFGPKSDQVKADLAMVDSLVGELTAYASENNFGIIVLSEYGLVPVKRAVALNKVLRQNGWLKTITIQDKEYIDFEASSAIAMVDHQIAHIYIQDKTLIPEIKEAVQSQDGIEQVLDDDGKKAFSIDHPNSGELIAIAETDSWFCYYWWFEDSHAPGFTRTVDIHRKPGYDPLELFFDPSIKGIPYTTELVKGSHGRPAQNPAELAVFIADIPEWGYENLFETSGDTVSDVAVGKSLASLWGTTIK